MIWAGNIWKTKMEKLFSSNIIERHNAMENLMTMDSFSVYGLMVASLMVGCWFIQKLI